MASNVLLAFDSHEAMTSCAIHAIKNIVRRIIAPLRRARILFPNLPVITLPCIF